MINAVFKIIERLNLNGEITYIAPYWYLTISSKQAGKRMIRSKSVKGLWQEMKAVELGE